MDVTMSEKLTTKTKIIYGIGDIGNAIVNTAVVFYLLLFYTDTVLISPALAGSALLVGKIWDAVNDPLFGWISDRTNSKRFGKRRVYMLFGAVPLMVAVALLWFAPAGISGTAAFIWIVITFILFDTLMTLTSVPYYAMTAELTPDYDERSSLTAFRMLMGVPAYIVGAAVTPIIVGFFALQQTGYRAMGIIYGVIAGAVLLVVALSLKERQETSERVSSTPPLKAFVLTLQNKAFVRLIVAYLVANLGFVLIQTLLAYFLTYQLNMADQVPLVMMTLLGSVFIFLFPWKKLAEKWNKGPAYGLGLGIGALSVALTFFLPAHNTILIFIVAFIAGLGFATNWIFPWAMVPDVIEYDQLKTGESRGGMYYGVWGFTSKLTNALAVAIAGWVLEIFRYVPNAAQSDFTLLGIRLFFGPVPAVIILIALPLLFWYPITREKHSQVRQEIELQQQALSAIGDD